jgi:flagellar L-ring protein precursor FlgH
MRTILLALTSASLLSGCAVADRVANVGKAPRFSRPTEVPAPLVERSLASSGSADSRTVRPASTYTPEAIEPASTASLFRSGSAGLFRDGRAYQRGDILTVRVNVSDRATFDNATTRSRTGSENANVATLLGLDKLIDRILPGKAESGAGVSGGSKSGNSGQGNTTRSETINLTLAGLVTEVLPNGNLAIRARQEMRVNYELRELVVTGLVRPQDIARDNSIRHTQIAEARVSYGGRGHLTDAQQARYGQQIYDLLFPF